MEPSQTHLARSRLVVVLPALIGLGLAGCNSTAKPEVETASVQKLEVEETLVVGPESVEEAIALLGQGKAVEARKLLIAILYDEPGHRLARRLLEQVDKDPKVLLGGEHFAYTVTKGDTYSGLAHRFLGDPMLFYALAKYNGSQTPSSLVPGVDIMIPGKKPVVAKKPASKPAAAKKTPPPARAEAAPKRANPAQARKLRGMALAALNGGSVDRAVVLLRQAAAADPSNGTIKADLARAERIQRTVRGR
jgi:hypothetical protein